MTPMARLTADCLDDPRVRIVEGDVAQLIGAVPTWQTTIRTEGHFRHTKEGTRTRGYRFDVNPSELQRLGPGEAYVARLDSGDASVVAGDREDLVRR